MIETYGKALVALIYTVATTAVPLLTGDGRVDAAEGVAIAIAICTAALTYVVPLAHRSLGLKTAVGAALAGLQVATTVITDGVNGADWLLIAFAVLSALGIAVAPAASPITGARVGWGTDTPPAR